MIWLQLQFLLVTKGFLRVSASCCNWLLATWLLSLQLYAGAMTVAWQTLAFQAMWGRHFGSFGPCGVTSSLYRQAGSITVKMPSCCLNLHSCHICCSSSLASLALDFARKSMPQAYLGLTTVMPVWPSVQNQVISGRDLSANGRISLLVRQLPEVLLPLRS